MYCKKCGSQIDDGTRYCPHCGAMQDGAQPSYQYQQAPYQAPPAYDSGSAGWGILGFFFPIVGLILFLIWRNEKPKSSKSAGIGALIGFIVELIPVIVIIIVFVAMAASVSGPDYYLISSLISSFTI